MSDLERNASLRRLMQLVPPPAKPLETDGTPPALVFADGKHCEYPPDFLALTQVYGSGDFCVPNLCDDDRYQDSHYNGGMVAEIFNPRAKGFESRLSEAQEFLQQWHEEGEDDFHKYEIHPNSPGLLQWGRSEGRKQYCWWTEGPSNAWPTIVFWEFRFFARYNMSVTEFLLGLASGELDARFFADESKPMNFKLGWMRFDPYTLHG